MNLAIIRVVAIVLFLYMTWRNLRGDYDEGKLISFGWFSILFFLVFSRIGFGLLNLGIWNSWKDWLMVWNKPGFNYLIGTLGFVLSVFIFSRMNQWKFFTFIENNLKNFLVFLGLLMIDELVRTRFDLNIVWYLLAIVVTYLIDLQLFKKYRSFVWYKSGKKGFVFLFSTFLINLLIALIILLSKGNPILAIIASIVSLTSLLGLFILGKVFDQLVVNKRNKDETE